MIDHVATTRVILFALYCMSFTLEGKFVLLKIDALDQLIKNKTMIFE